MSWRPSFDEPLPVERTLDTFRESVACLKFEGRTLGYLAFNVTHMRRQLRGHLWWRQWAPAVEVVEWRQAMVDTNTAEIGNMSDGIIEEPESNEWLASVRNGEVDDFRHDVAPRRYDVVWLTGRERDDAWEGYGFATAR